MKDMKDMISSMLMAAKVAPENKLLNDAKEAIQTYQDNKSEKNKSSMMFHIALLSLSIAFEKQSLLQAIDLVQKLDQRQELGKILES